MTGAGTPAAEVALVAPLPATVSTSVVLQLLRAFVDVKHKRGPQKPDPARRAARVLGNEALHVGIRRTGEELRRLLQGGRKQPQAAARLLRRTYGAVVGDCEGAPGF